MKKRRRWRWPDGYYHSFNRGARRLKIFADEQDRRVFFRYLGEAALKRGVTVIAYCLVGNHYHLVLRCPGEAMGAMIRELEKRYARYFNRRTGFEGALFQGRFGSTWLPDLQSVAYVTRYVHGNARDVGEAPARYRWSSVGAYLGWADVPRWLDPKPVLDYVGGRAAYRRYLAELPPRRANDRPEDEAQSVFVRHIADRIARLLAARPGLVEPRSVKPLVCWAAVRFFGLRPRVLAKVLGYASGRGVSVAVSRLEACLDSLPRVRELLDQLITK